MAILALTPTQLPSAYTTTAALRDTNANMLIADRGPSWIRYMNNGRNLDSIASDLKAKADGIASDGADNAWTPKTVDYLRGAAWHAQQGVASLRTGVANALAGHEDLQAQAAAILDPKAPITYTKSFDDFETAVKHTDPSLLNAIADAGNAARGSFERAASDVTEAREFLRGMAQTIPH
jgi:hypothetical protein